MIRNPCADRSAAARVGTQSARQAAPQRQQRGAHHWIVATGGSSSGAGTLEDPWDIATALLGGPTGSEVGPGDWVVLTGGTYHRAFENAGLGFVVQLAGAEGLPIQIRPHAGARVIIDGGLNVQAPTSHLWIWDLEILCSDAWPPFPIEWLGNYSNLSHPWGGLNVYSGAECRFINLISYANAEGVSWWASSTDSELYGAVIYDNGWQGTDRGHGHAIYTQNEQGVKVISDCIMTGGYGYTLHAYGEGAHVDYYRVEGNMAYGANGALIGGYQPSHGIRVRDNYLYGVPMQIGYGSTQNVDCDVRDNVVVNETLGINNYQTAVQVNNLVLGVSDDRPEGALVILRENRYDPHRANLAIYNWDQTETVAVDVSGFMAPGASYRLLDPTDLWGTPVQTGTCGGATISVPVSGEFGCFVLSCEPH